MPAPAAARQPERSASGWFAAAAARRLLRLEQRALLPLVAGCYGRTGLYLRCDESVSAELAGNVLQRVLRLHARDGRWHGDVVCEPDALPLLRESVDLVVLLHAIECTALPRALLGEIERVLVPEGNVIVLALNPYSPWRLRWMGSGLHALGAGRCCALLREAGLEPSRLSRVGPVLPWMKQASRDPGGAWFSALGACRAAYLVQARKRRAGMTPLRPAAGQVSLDASVRAG